VSAISPRFFASQHKRLSLFVDGKRIANAKELSKPTVELPLSHHPSVQYRQERSAQKDNAA
jgi:hypothetical protein